MGMFKKLMRAALASVALTAALPALSQDVTLKSLDGSIEMRGTLRSFDGDFYRLETEFGVITVGKTDVRCEGPACPVLNAYFSEIRIAAPMAMQRDLLRGVARQ